MDILGTVNAATTFYPLPAFHFAVYFQNLLPMGALDVRFQEVTGLSAELNVEEWSEGGENRFVHKLPKGTKFPNLVLKRALMPASALTKWAYDAIYNMEIKPSDVKVVLLNEMHIPLMTWDFRTAYPVKLQVSDLKAMENGFVIETLELAYQRAEQGNLLNLLGDAAGAAAALL